MSETKLTPKQLMFVKEYLVDLNGTQAAIRAGYSPKTANEQAARLLANVSIKRTVQAEMDKRAQRVETKADSVLAELSRIGYADIRPLFKDDGTIKDPKDWPDDLARAVASFEVQETFEMLDGQRIWTGYLKKIKIWDKPKSLELLGKNQKLFTDKVEHSGSISLEELVAGSKDTK